MMTCHNCGRAHTSATKRFCQYCGAPVGPAAGGPKRAGTRIGSQSGQTGRTSARSLLVTGAALAVLIVVVILFVVNARSSTSQGTAITAPNGDGAAIVPVSTEPPESTTTESVPDVLSEDEPTTTDTSSDDPATVVRNYYAAVNSHDYRTAWELGGENLGDRSYDSFVAGYSTTVSSEPTAISEDGDEVDVTLTALWTDGSTHVFKGSYTVTDGMIVSGKLHKLS